jgi:hypothetical protein
LFDNAFTTDAPTPCSPPDAPYAPPPNLPPACSSVSTTSSADTFFLAWRSTGMPRPLSMTSTDRSRWKMTSMRFA